jgi:hypothetical protein
MKLMGAFNGFEDSIETLRTDDVLSWYFRVYFNWPDA